jgi:hypothetical protein
MIAEENGRNTEDRYRFWYSWNNLKSVSAPAMPLAKQYND